MYLFLPHSQNYSLEVIGPVTSLKAQRLKRLTCLDSLSTFMNSIIARILLCPTPKHSPHPSCPALAATAASSLAEGLSHNCQAAARTLTGVAASASRPYTHTQKGRTRAARGGGTGGRRHRAPLTVRPPPPPPPSAGGGRSDPASRPRELHSPRRRWARLGRGRGGRRGARTPARRPTAIARDARPRPARSAAAPSAATAFATGWPSSSRSPGHAPVVSESTPREGGGRGGGHTVPKRL